MPVDPTSLSRDLLGLTPDAIEPLLVWADRATYRIVAGGHGFVIKADDDRATVAREVAGHRRAAAGGVRVPELLAASDDALAMTWVDGIALHQEPAREAWSDAGAQLRIAHDLGGGPPFGTGFGGFNPVQPSWRLFFREFAETMLGSCERDLDFPARPAERIRAALRAAAPLLDAPNVVWCHGDFQPDHVLVNPATKRVTAIIDWADHGAGDMGWDVAVLTIDDDSHLDAFLAGYDATDELRAALDRLLPLYSVVRLLGEAGWLAEHDQPYAANLTRAIEWQP